MIKLERILTSINIIPLGDWDHRPTWGCPWCTGELEAVYPSLTTCFSFIEKEHANVTYHSEVCYPTEEWLRFPKVCRQNKYGLGKELVILVFMMVECTFPSPFTRGFIFTCSHWLLITLALANPVPQSCFQVKLVSLIIASGVLSWWIWQKSRAGKVCSSTLNLGYYP